MVWTPSINGMLLKFRHAPGQELSQTPSKRHAPGQELSQTRSKPRQCYPNSTKNPH